MSSMGCLPVNHFNRGNSAVCVCESVCAARRRWGGVGIVCHQMNSWGETNEECREKEGGFLIGPSLSLSLSVSLLFSSSRGESRRLNVGFTEVRRDFYYWHCKRRVLLIGQ